jgi:hypothetical protein
MVERGSGGVESLSMADLCRETGGRVPLLATLEDRKKRLWRWASLS